MSRDMQHLLLVLVGGAILRISLMSEIYLRYVKPGMRPFLVASGICLLALGLAGVLRDVLSGNAGRGDRTDAVSAVAAATGDVPAHAHDQEDEEGSGEHGHDHGYGPKVAWLLCLPVFAIFFIAPPPLGSYTAGRSAATVAAPSVEADLFPPLAAGDPLPMQVSEFTTRAVWDKSGALRGRTVELTGFVTPRKGGGWYLTRLVMSCCAADAQTYKVQVMGAAALSADTWVRLSGTWLPNGQVQSDRAIPAIQAQTVQRIVPPAQAYE